MKGRFKSDIPTFILKPKQRLKGSSENWREREEDTVVDLKAGFFLKITVGFIRLRKKM